MTDFTKLSDEEFSKACEELYAEQDRRAKMRDIPDKMQQLSQEYESLGGDKADLVAKMNEPIVDKAELEATPVEEIKENTDGLK